MGEAKNQHTSTTAQSAEAEFDPLCQLRPRPEVVVGAASTRRSGAFMTSHDALSLILRRLDRIERKLGCLLEELRTPPPSAIRHTGANRNYRARY